MLIVCPTCGTSYMIDQTVLGAAGRNVRCTRCRTLWFAGGPDPMPEPPVAGPVEANAPTLPVRSARAGRADTLSPIATEAATARADGISTVKPEPLVAAATTAPPVEPPAAAQPETASPPEATAATAGEAVPAIVADAPPLAPAFDHEPQPEASETDADNEAAASFDARRRMLQARRKQSRRSSRWTAAILVLVAINVAVIGARNEVVRYFPQTASLFAAIGLPVNLRNLKFEKVKLSTEEVGGIAMLTVQGSIASEAGKPVGVPRLRFAVRNATGQEVYTWTMAPPRSILEPGAKMEFHSQIPVPKVEATDVMVRFLSAQDAGAK